MEMIYPSKEEDFVEEQEVEFQNKKVRCSFSPEKAKEYGIEVRESCGVLYALCPICSTEDFLGTDS